MPSQVTVEAFVRVLMGRHDETWPSSKRLSSTNESRILLYMTGKKLSLSLHIRENLPSRKPFCDVLRCGVLTWQAMVGTASSSSTTTRRSAARTWYVIATAML